jgi:hypothetical protein
MAMGSLLGELSKSSGYAATYRLFVPDAVQIPIGRIYATATALS